MGGGAKLVSGRSETLSSPLEYRVQGNFIFGSGSYTVFECRILKTSCFKYKRSFT